jgi:S1-C subfamily serine protease
MSRAKRIARRCCAVALAHAATIAHALPPDQIFDRVAAGVWSVKAYGAEERLLASASGVVVAPGKVVTSCQVLARARQVHLRRGNTIYDAKLEFPDVERDLCQLDVPGLSAPTPAVGTARGLRTGQRLYVVGFSRGNEQTLGEGLVSAIADSGTGRQRIQTTVPASAGLRGAGVFDEEARLVGVVTFSPPDQPATAFAVPADWLAEVAGRGRAALAARAVAPEPVKGATASSAAPGLPAAGTVWTYGFIEKIFSRRQIELSVRVMRADGSIVEEAVTAAGSGGGDTRRAINAPDSRFVQHALSRTVSVTELAPYLLAASAGKAPADIGDPGGYPIGSPGLPSWIAKATVQGWDQVAVPAGTFKALRVDVTGRRARPIGGRSVEAGRFAMSVWYALEVKRIVRLEHRVWTADSLSESLAADEVLELLSYRPPS